MDSQFVTIIKSKAIAFVVFFGDMLSLLKPFNGEPWFDKKGNDKRGLLPDKLFGGHWLQACYSDAFGDAPPRKVSKRQTFRNGGGNFLSYFDAKISDATGQEIRPDLSSGLKSEAESKPYAVCDASLSSIFTRFRFWLI